MEDPILQFAHDTFDLFSDSEFLYKYLNERDRELKVRSSLYVIQDTQLVINFYLSDDLKEVGSNLSKFDLKSFSYLIVYGILNSLYLQQDAIISLCIALNICDKSIIFDNYILNKIRNIRNNSTGHPSNRRDKGKTFISQLSVSKYHFNFLEVKGGNTEFINVDLKSLASQQIAEMKIIVSKISQHLTEMNKNL